MKNTNFFQVAVKPLLLSVSALTLVCPTLALGQESNPTDLMVVFDGSGSMWGQLEGQTKIETAREVLSSVLKQTDLSQKIGMVAYGHREKGQCSDIETIVPLGAAESTVPLMISEAMAMNPKGKTPLSDAVRKAAEELRYLENAATVVLITDGLETCNADPCALGRELEASGLDFTAHVVGFGLSDADGAQIQCLAEETGGLYLKAINAEGLESALNQVTAEPKPSKTSPRTVNFNFRDFNEGSLLGMRQLKMTLLRENGDAVEAEHYDLNYPESKQRSAQARLIPGRYVARIDRDGGQRGGYTTEFDFEITDGDGVQNIEGVLAGQLTISPYINPEMAFDPANPPTSASSNQAWAYFDIFEMDGDEVGQQNVFEAYSGLSFPLNPGRYLIKASLAKSAGAERYVTVKASEETTIDFSFNATPVYVESLAIDGEPVKRQTSYFYDGLPKGRGYFTSGSRSGESDLAPFYLPTGTFGLNVGQEGGGDDRSLLTVKIKGDYAPVRLRVNAGEVLPEPEAEYFESRIKSCVQMIKVKYSACLIKDMAANMTEPSSR